MIEFVWAEDNKHAIGYKNHLPWHLPADLKHFKDLTMGHPMIMGRKTFTSLPKVLPGRQHLVLTHDQQLIEQYRNDERVTFFTSIDDLKSFVNQNPEACFCAIGGVSIFELLADKVDILEKTLIYEQFEADTFMPEIDYSKFELINKEDHQIDDQNHYPYTYFTYKRKQ